MSPDDAEPAEVTLEELAALRAGELSAEEEEKLQMRIANDPQSAAKLWALDNVHRLFELRRDTDGTRTEGGTDSSGAAELAAARLQARIAQEALRRAEESSSHQSGPTDLPLGDRGSAPDE